MLKLIDGTKGWKFIDLSESDLDEAFALLEHSPEKLSFFLDANKCEVEIIGKIAYHQKKDILKSIHLLNGWGDISNLANLSELRSISIGVENSRFDFSNLRQLREIGGVWSKRWINLENCQKLSKFSVSAYPGTIEEIPNIRKIESILLIQPRLTSLAGLECASTLRSLNIIRASKLIDFESISLVSSTLEELMIDKCPRISSFKQIYKLRKLRELVLADCKKIESISFVTSLDALTCFSIFGTIVEDNDLSPCLTLDSLIDFRSENVKTYHPSVAVIQEKARDNI